MLKEINKLTDSATDKLDKLADISKNLYEENLKLRIVAGKVLSEFKDLLESCIRFADHGDVLQDYAKGLIGYRPSAMKELEDLL